MRLLGLVVVLTLTAHADASERVAVREIAKNSFLATLSSDRELAIEEAQQQLLPVAVEICQGVRPVFGQYTFESAKPIVQTSPDGQVFEFRQTFSCEESATAVPQAPPTTLSAEESSQLVDLAERETARALATPDGAEQEEFHSRFSSSLSAMLPLAEWLEQQRSLHQQAGLIVGRPLLKVSIYTDPPNSPCPGTYIAIDFQASYERAPFRCGYVMWLRDPAGTISVLRPEDGIIGQKDAGAMSPGELAQTKQQFRCFAP